MHPHDSGTQKPHTNRQCLCRHQTALTFIDVGVVASCPSCKAKSAAAMFVWFFEHPDSNASRWSRFHLGDLLQRVALESFPFWGLAPVVSAGVVFISEVPMPLINYKETMSFPDAVEAAVILLALCLVKLRDEAAFRDDHDPTSLNAAHFFIDQLDDALKESEALASALESRLTAIARGMM